MTEAVWLLQETKPLDRDAVEEMERELPTGRDVAVRGDQQVPNLAIRIQDVTIHDNRKWFGEADIRIDALVVHGRGAEDEPESFYVPQTFRFSRVTDGTQLPTAGGGLLVFYGKPRHFLDVFITVSRDRRDSDNLATLLSSQLQAPEVKSAMGTLLGLAVAAPQVATVTAALGAAAVLGNFAYQVLREATGATIGLYRTSWLQHRDRFGVGRHPELDEDHPDGRYRVNDLSFWYEIVVDQDGQDTG